MTELDRTPGKIRRKAIELVEKRDSMAYEEITARVATEHRVKQSRVQSVLDRLEAQGEIYLVDGMVKRT